MSDASAEQQLLNDLAEEFAERQRRGERPSLGEYTDRYPQLAGQIRELFPALAMMEQARPTTADATGAYEAPAAVDGARLERLGDYRILREVGRGGMGIVYEAEQVSLGRHVALKVLPAAALVDGKHLRRFEREAQAAARLHHTNIVPVYGVGEDSGLHYYVMQFIPGLALDEVLAEVRRLRQGRVAAPGNGRTANASAAAQALLTGAFSLGSQARSASEAKPEPPADSAVHLPGQAEGSALTDSGRAYWHGVARIGIQVAEALAYASGQGILHRDIKPANLLLDGRGTVWVTDFGLAKAADSEDLTHTGDVVGTLRYMAPERFQGAGDTRSDIYALGLTLYELLTLRPAFPEADRNRLIQQVMHAEPQAPRRLNPDVPRDLETIVLKAVDRDPGRRYQSAADLAADLRRYVEDRPIRARRVSARERFWRWCRRNPLVAGLTAAVFLLLVAVAVVASVAYVQTSLALSREASERTEAQRERRRAEDSLYHSLVREAQALRRARGDGYRAEVWQRLLQALQVETPARDVTQLRQEAVACMGDFVGLGPTVWTDFPVDIFRVALHPDGRQVAVALGNATVLFRRLAGGEEIARLPGQSAPVADLTFGPGGHVLVTRGANGRVGVWEQGHGGTWACTRKFAAKAGTDRGSVVLTPNGKQLAALDDRAVSLWSLAEGARAAKLAGTQDEPFHCLAVSPDGTWLAAGYRSGGTHGVLVWDLTSRQLRHSLLPRLDYVRALVFSPDGKNLACACTHGTAVYDTEEFRRGLVIRGDSADAIAFSPDNRLLAVPGVVLGNVRLWSLAANREVAVLTSKAWVNTLSFSPDGTRLVAAHPRSIQLWNLAGTRERRTLAGHTEGVPGTVFSPDGKILVSVSKDQTLKAWDPVTGRLLHELTGFAGHLQAVAFSAGGRIVATGDEAGGVRLWDAETWQQLAAPAHDLGKQIWAVAFSPDGGYFAACGERGLAVWRLQQGAADRTPNSALSANSVVRRVTRREVQALCFSPDASLLAWGEGSPSQRMVLHLWDLANACEQPAPPARIGWLIHGLTFYPDGKRLSVVSPERTDDVWDITTGRMAFSLRPENELTGFQSVVALSSDGRWLAAQAERAVAIWDTETRQRLFTLPEERTLPWSLAWNPTRNLLAVGTSDGGLVLWNIPMVRRQLADLGLDW